MEAQTVVDEKPFAEAEEKFTELVARLRIEELRRMRHSKLPCRRRRQGDGAPLPAGLAHFVAAAESDARFASLWRSDDTSRAYALACLALAPLVHFTNRERRQFYQQIATRPRRVLLAELAAVDVTQSSLRILPRCATADFTSDDWRSLLRQLLCANDRRALSQVPSISARLVRQFDAIPSLLRVPRLLALASRCLIPTERWRRLAQALDRAGPPRRSALVRSSHMVHTLAAFYDFFQSVTDAAQDASSFPHMPDLGPLLQRMADTRSMRREGLAMRNCLGGLVDNAASGAWAYYSWIGSERATVELRQSVNGWRVARVAGVGNAPVSEKTERTIQDLIAGTLGPAAAEPVEKALATPSETADCLKSVAALGASLFSPDERAKATAALRAIRGRSLAHGDGAFCIFGFGPFYVQFLASVGDPEYLAEIVSHRVLAEIEPRIDERIVEMLESAGFRWPRGRDNFSRLISVRDDSDCACLADFALGTLHAMFGFRRSSADELSIHVCCPGEVPFVVRI